MSASGACPAHRCAAVAAALLLALAGAAAAPAHADNAGVGNTPPQGPARIAFAPDFPPLTDHEWGFALGGFGGTSRGDAPKRVPVIFVHGNNVDACDWYPVRDDFRDAGWSDQALWALSYNGLGNNNGSALHRSNPECAAEHAALGNDGQARVTGNDVNVKDLYDFIVAVRAYTGSPRFSIVSHSLGVTLARKTLWVHRELRKDLVAFVGIAGGNHGTSFCPPGSESLVNGCDEIAVGSAWLDELNGPDGADETYAPARWLTVYDGSGAGDPAFVGLDAQSPALKGADNRQFPGTYHNDLRIDADIVATYRLFLEQAEAAATAEAAAAGGGAVPASTLVLVLALLLARRRRPVCGHRVIERQSA